MKKTKLIPVLAILLIAAFTSCKKSYTCSCTTVIGASSVILNHNIDNVYPLDAKKTCNSYEDEGNTKLPGSTTCHL